MEYFELFKKNSCNVFVKYMARLGQNLRQLVMVFLTQFPPIEPSTAFGFQNTGRGRGIDSSGKPLDVEGNC